MKKLALVLVMSAGLFACTEKPAETATQNTNTQAQNTQAQNTQAQNTQAQNTAQSTQNTTPSTPSSSLPADAPVVKVVTTGNIPPMEFLNEQGNPTGIEIDLLRAIGEQQGIKFEFYKERFANLLPSLEAGKYQVVASGMSLTSERTAKFGHTVSYLTNPNVIVHKPETKITSFNDLKNFRVGTMHNTVQEQEAGQSHYKNKQMLHKF